MGMRKKFGVLELPQIMVCIDEHRFYLLHLNKHSKCFYTSWTYLERSNLTYCLLVLRLVQCHFEIGETFVVDFIS